MNQQNQLSFPLENQLIDKIEQTMSPARLRRYDDGNIGDRNAALKRYVWNAKLCEAFYLPTQMCEVALRNAIHNALQSKHGTDWYERGSFLCTLPSRLKDELDSVIKEERLCYGSGMTIDHLISGLSLGFWVHLLTKNYDGVFWPQYFQLSFPNKPNHIDRDRLYGMVDRFRVHRNRIAHQKPIYDRQPSAELQNLMTLIKWICEHTLWFVRQTSNVQRTISQKPI